MSSLAAGLLACVLACPLASAQAVGKPAPSGTDASVAVAPSPASDGAAVGGIDLTGMPRRVLDAEAATRPVDPALLGALTEWTGADPWTSDSIEGKVLVIALWHAGDAASARAMPALARVARRFGSDRVMMVGVHPADGWDAATGLVESGRVRVPVALDTDGSFAAAFHNPKAPYVIVVDRSGHVREADVSTGKLTALVSKLSRESPDVAASTVADRVDRFRREAERAEAFADRRATGSSSRVDAETYADAEWPAFNDPRLISARDLQGQPLPVALGRETWLTEPPRMGVGGRVLILDHWATWCGPCRRASSTLDQVQRRFGDEVAVLAISGQRESESTVRAYLSQNSKSYFHLFDRTQTVHRALGVQAIPHVAVLSTDGVIRWQGNPNDPAFVRVVEQVIRVDPKLVARRDG
jgi:thiol-disulfide isomerase/thioredoxin